MKKWNIISRLRIIRGIRVGENEWLIAFTERETEMQTNCPSIEVIITYSKVENRE